MANNLSPTLPLERRAVPSHPAERRDGACLDLVIFDEALPDEPVLCLGWGCVDREHPADYLVAFDWPHGHRYRSPRCRRWWMTPAPLGCMACPELEWAADRDDVCRIVEVLR